MRKLFIQTKHVEETRRHTWGLSQFDGWMVIAVGVYVAPQSMTLCIRNAGVLQADRTGEASTKLSVFMRYANASKVKQADIFLSSYRFYRDFSVALEHAEIQSLRRTKFFSKQTFFEQNTTFTIYHFPRIIVLLVR